MSMCCCPRPFLVPVLPGSVEKRDSGVRFRARSDVFSRGSVAVALWCGRFAYNHMLAAVKANLDQRAAEKSYGLTGDESTLFVGRSGVLAA